MTRQSIIPPYKGSYNVQNDFDGNKSFNWNEIEKNFSWHQTGKVNMAYECIDRHVEEGSGEKTALYYIDENSEQTITYRELKEATDRWATVLKKNGVKKGDFLFVFLPKHPECHIAILAAIKLGAIVGPLFEAFMEEAIRDRISDCEGKFLITNEEYLQRVPLSDLPSLETIFLTDQHITAANAISIPEELAHTVVEDNIIEWVNLEDGLNIHYTSGSTGKPKGIIHAHRAMIQQYITGRWVLDLKEDDVYWCTAHPGWVTGCVYGIFAPLLNRATIVLHGGRFNADSWYETIEKAGVTVWYSAPTAFRMLMAEGVETLKRYDVSSLRHILSVGEPLNPEVIYWGVEHLTLRIHDTWWMTETGAQLIVNLPTEPIKPGSMGKPFPTIETAILDDEGNNLPVGEVGHLAIKGPWPAIMKEVWKNKEKYASYFPFDTGWYLSGDLALKDEDGYIFFQGRSDDMINSSGERIGPFEVESKLIEHPAVAEAGVIGKPDFVRGEIVKAFIVLKKGYASSPELLANIRLFVRNRLAAHVAPREIEVIEELPKTKISGKILRRELKAREIDKLKVVEV
ncbi:acetate--CoA ligase [Lederbergia wuyishanensis]|uniref:acetate--CoA ligase n=1 Tax=Lederbergia wuyishanensis TaxID=1347903 RepID=A0ABU0D7D0_9BACI|nr:acetate--CoA ligase [Lederbergia wuyishanensis]MCJ8008998.1 acetate--CoA ligase [Lederbergia wuyishanensis]MDQ0344328.1 acetyl-CoA synthetase [Lederbergia wuyishanensis]